MEKKQIKAVNFGAKKSDRESGIIDMLNKAISLMPKRPGGYSAADAMIEVLGFYIERH